MHHGFMGIQVPEILKYIFTVAFDRILYRLTNVWYNKPRESKRNNRDTERGYCSEAQQWYDLTRYSTESQSRLYLYKSTR